MAPFESVSQPPDTARQMEPVKSPSAWVSAAASSAAFGTACTQWWCPYAVCSRSTTAAKPSGVPVGSSRASAIPQRTARASRDRAGITVSPARSAPCTSVPPPAAAASAAAVNIAAYTPFAVWLRVASRQVWAAAAAGSPGWVQP